MRNLDNRRVTVLLVQAGPNGWDDRATHITLREGYETRLRGSGAGVCWAAGALDLKFLPTSNLSD